MKKNFLVLMLMVLGIGSVYADKVETLASPSGNIKLEVAIGNRLTYSVFYGEEQILKDCPISLQVGAETFGTKPRLSSAKRSKVDEVIRPVVPLKYAEVP
ncbi:MAG: glycoside hydrolase family 97 N-terminal domain-containing protein, partial [Bacteroidaceae bacterium]|nr:glycoside hydrolase family 97 N-terminal domain-containing protein [Bacteroidaceae bacterium]